MLLYLTDFLTQHFQRLVIEMLGLDRFPELLPRQKKPPPPRA